MKNQSGSGIPVFQEDDENFVQAKMSFIIVFPARKDKEYDANEILLQNGRDNLPACKPSNHFHIEYHPCPNNESRKIDIVNYGHAAKVTHTKGVNFLSDEMVKINTKDNVSWIVVNHTHQLTRELGKLNDTFDYKVETKLVDSRAAISTRAKHDRPRVYRMSTLVKPEAEETAWWKPYLDDACRRVSEGDYVASDKSRVTSATLSTKTSSTRNSKKVEGAKMYMKNAPAALTFEMGEMFFDKLNMLRSSKGKRGNGEEQSQSWISFAGRLELDKKLLTRKQEEYFNPMKITLGRLGPMPTKPHTPDYLRNHPDCKPVTASFSAFGNNYTTNPVQHDSVCALNTSFVILTGLIPKEKIADLFRRVMFRFKIHDRDLIQRAQKQVKTDPVWNRINPSRLSSAIKTPVPNSFGEAKLSLLDFAKGAKSLTVSLPVFGKQSPALKGYKGQLLPLSPGAFVDSGTELEVTVQVKFPYQLSHPLVAQVNEHTPYGLIMFYTAGGASANLELIKEHVKKHNVANNKDSDLHASGYHLEIGKMQYLTVEGPASGIVKEIWELARQYSNVNCLYNSSIFFSERRYINQQEDFSRILIESNIKEFISEGWSYSGNLMPRDALETLIKISCFSKYRKIESILSADLLLTEEDLNSITDRDFEQILNRKWSQDGEEHEKNLKTRLLETMKSKPRKSLVLPRGFNMM